MIESFITNFAYAGVLLVLIVSGLGLPMPEDLPLILGGYLCQQGAAELRFMIPLTLLAVVGADVMVYALGRRFGYLVPKLPLFRRFLTPPRLERAGEFLVDHGGKALFAGRFMPGLRTPIFFTAGLLKVPFWKFLLVDGFAALISVPVLVLVGFYFSEYLEEVRKWATGTQIGFAIVLAVVIGGYIWYKRRKHRAMQSEALASLEAGADMREAEGRQIISEAQVSQKHEHEGTTDSGKTTQGSDQTIVGRGRKALWPES